MEERLGGQSELGSEGSDGREPRLRLTAATEPTIEEVVETSRPNTRYH